VIRDDPLDVAGNPSRPTFWLTCPDAVKAVSRLEADGAIRRLNERFADDADFRKAVERAHAEAAEERARMLPAAVAWGGVGGTRRGISVCTRTTRTISPGATTSSVPGSRAGGTDAPRAPDRGRIAVVDQGTHSCRLLVVERAPDGAFLELASDMVITKLGQGVDATVPSTPRPSHATNASSRDTCAGRGRWGCRPFASPRPAPCATHRTATCTWRRSRACRHRPTGHRRAEEARLSFLGGTYGLSADDGPFLLLDIGGGSTEFVVGASRGGRAAGQHPDGLGPADRDVCRHRSARSRRSGEVRRSIAERLDEAELAVPEIHTARTFVAVSGTATTMQAIALGLDRYDPDQIHRTWLALTDAERVLADLARMTNAERAALPVMAPGRGDVIVAGGAVLVETMRRFGIDRALVSETDILLGLAYDALGVG
jgi:exopolyphosphatase/guanosine-5'-triphosphate,3'-diphosphate pyrophosphatase